MLSYQRPCLWGHCLDAEGMVEGIGNRKGKAIDIAYIQHAYSIDVYIHTRVEAAACAACLEASMGTLSSGSGIAPCCLELSRFLFNAGDPFAEAPASSEPSTEAPASSERKHLSSSAAW